MNATFPKLSRNAWLTACSAVALFFAGCGGDGEPQPDEPRIEPAAAIALADASEEIALLIDEGRVCDAAHKADEFLFATEAEIEKGTVPPALASELETNAKALQDQVNCEEDDNDKGKGNKNKDEEEND